MLALLTKLSNMYMSVLKQLSNGGGDMKEQTAKAVDAEIKRYMDESGNTYTWLAERLGMNQLTLHNKRTGKTEWKWSEILKLCELTGKSPDELAELK